MSIAGAIEDFPLKDILQIISFSRKSGTLHVSGEKGKANVVFKMGAIVHAMAPVSRADFGSIAIKHGFAVQANVDEAVAIQKGQPEVDRQPLGHILIKLGVLRQTDVERLVKEQISLALRELLAWATGSFVFEVHKVSSPDSIGVGFGEMALDHGLDVQRLLLEAMKFFDDRARAKAAAPPAAPVVQATFVEELATPAPPPVNASMLRIVLLHEEGWFRDTLEERLREEGLEVDAGTDPEQALGMALEHRDAGLIPVLVTDLKTGAGTFRGSPILEKRSLAAAHVPVVLLAEPGAEEMRERAFSLGARHLLGKPVPTEAGDAAYVRAVEDFAVDVAFMAKSMLAEEGIAGGIVEVAAGEPGEEIGTKSIELPSDFRDFLTMLRAEDATSVTLKLLSVIGRRFPRSILLHLKGGVMTIKGAYGTTRRGTDVYQLIKDLRIELRQCPGIESAFESATPRRLMVGPDVGQLADLIGPPASSECLIIPIMCHFRPVGLIYADTGASGTPIGDLEIFQELCNRVSEVLGEALLRQRGKRYLTEGRPTTSWRRPLL